MENEVQKLIRKSEDYKVREEKLEQEEVMGDLIGVQQMADLWARYHEQLEAIEFSLLLKFCRLENFDDKNLLFYRKGLEAMNKFIEDCFLAIQEKNRK